MIRKERGIIIEIGWGIDALKDLRNNRKNLEKEMCN